MTLGNSPNKVHNLLRESKVSKPIMLSGTLHKHFAKSNNVIIIPSISNTANRQVNLLQKLKQKKKQISLHEKFPDLFGSHRPQTKLEGLRFKSRMMQNHTGSIDNFEIMKEVRIPTITHSQILVPPCRNKRNESDELHKNYISNRLSEFRMFSQSRPNFWSKSLRSSSELRPPELTGGYGFQ